MRFTNGIIFLVRKYDPTKNKKKTKIDGMLKFIIVKNIWNPFLMSKQKYCTYLLHLTTVSFETILFQLNTMSKVASCHLLAICAYVCVFVWFIMIFIIRLLCFLFVCLWYVLVAYVFFFLSNTKVSHCRCDMYICILNTCTQNQHTEALI